MPIQGITDGYGPVIGQPASEAGDVDKLDFMSLLVAQIKNQDPMSPMDNAEFTSQITQFTMLEEMQTLTAKMEENVLIGQSLNNTAMLELVGKNVTVAGDVTQVQDGAVAGNMLATEGPGVATIQVKDSSGTIVRTYNETVKNGLNDVTWDGELDDGTMAEDGDYTLSVSVSNNDLAVPFVTLMTGPVEGLRYDNNVGVVQVGDYEFYVSEIYRIS